MKDNALKQYLTVYAQCDLLNVRLDWDEKLKLFYYLTYFCYYLRASLHFWYYSWTPLYCFNEFLILSTVLSVINFQFQQNKQYLNTLFIVQVHPLTQAWKPTQKM